jgi:hypothetical protein
VFRAPHRKEFYGEFATSPRAQLPNLVSNEILGRGIIAAADREWLPMAWLPALQLVELVKGGSVAIVAPADLDDWGKA